MALVPRGAGSGMAGGSVGRGVIVDLSQGFCWTAPDWPRRTIWVGTAVTWAEVNEAARPFGLRLPPDPSSGAFATSGGMVATNAAGPRSVRCGSVRNWVEAVEILEVDGSARRVEREVQGTARWHLDHAARELVRARFPRTRKSSAGYALDRFADSAAELDLLVGSEGTLAFVTADRKSTRLNSSHLVISYAVFCLKKKKKKKIRMCVRELNNHSASLCTQINAVRSGVS